MIAYADQFTGQYRDTAQLIEAMLGTMKIFGREQRNWKGFRLADIDWLEAEPDWLTQAPMAVIVLDRADRGDVGVDECRRRLKEKTFAARQAAEALKQRQQDEGRLL